MKFQHRIKSILKIKKEREMKQVHVNHRKSNLISFVLVVWRAAEETTNEKTRRMMMSNCRGDLKLMLEKKNSQ